MSMDDQRITLAPGGPPPPDDWRVVMGGAALSVGVHILVALTLFIISWLGSRSGPEEPPEDNVIQARLVVRQGPERPKHLLPRLDSPPAPPPPPAPVSLGKVKEEEAKPDPAKLEAERRRRQEEERRRREEEERRREEERRDRMLEALAEFQPGTGDRPVRPTPEGSPDGARDGDATEARPGSQYAARVERMLRQVWSVPTYIPNDLLAKLRSWVVVDIAPDGMIESFQVVTPSGENAFDETVRVAIGRYSRGTGTSSFGPFPPDEGLGKRLRLRIQFTGASMLR